jgi:riboflavin-specific deaminase-like protein
MAASAPGYDRAPSGAGPARPSQTGGDIGQPDQADGDVGHPGQAGADPGQSVALRRLLPAGTPVSAQDAVAELELAGLSQTVSPTVARGGRRRPYVALNMVSTLDGHATLAGRSGPIGGQADRQLFHALRTVVDAVMVGAGTVRTERYRRLVREESTRRIRRERGLEEEPWACVVSGSLDLPESIPLLGDPAARVAILTSSTARLPRRDGGARVEYVRCTRDGRLDLSSAMAELYERLSVHTVLCEGGPHLNSQLLADGLVDELFLSLSPKLAGEDVMGDPLRIVAAPAIEPPAGLRLVSVLEHGSHLFLRYRVAPS